MRDLAVRIEVFGRSQYIDAEADHMFWLAMHELSSEGLVPDVCVAYNGRFNAVLVSVDHLAGEAEREAAAARAQQCLARAGLSIRPCRPPARPGRQPEDRDRPQEWPDLVGRDGEVQGQIGYATSAARHTRTWTTVRR